MEQYILIVGNDIAEYIKGSEIANYTQLSNF